MVRQREKQEIDVVMLAWCRGWVGGPARVVEIVFVVDEVEETSSMKVLSTPSEQAIINSLAPCLSR